MFWRDLINLLTLYKQNLTQNSWKAITKTFKAKKLMHLESILRSQHHFEIILMTCHVYPQTLFNVEIEYSPYLACS